MDIDCEGWARILKVFPEMDFTDVLSESPELAPFIKDAINKKALDMEDPEQDKNLPKLDNDFSKIILLNGLPVCDEKKAEKLTQLLIKLFAKRNFTITEKDIDMMQDAEMNTTGQAFITLKNDEQAKIASALFNGFALDKKHTFSSCTVPDFDKIMAYVDPTEEQKNKQTDYLEIYAQILETKLTQYAYQANKNVNIDSLEGQNKVLIGEEKTDAQTFPVIQNDKPFTWSPRGTYLISIKSDKVEFIGGSKMTPILTINETKVESVLFSPCERYILVYQPKNDLSYTIWNFQSGEKLREFEQFANEDGNTYQWSHDGNYIAKMIKKEIVQEPVEGEEVKEVEEEDKKYKTFIAVFELPSMKMITDSDGNRTSIPVDGLQEFHWAPHKSMIIYNSIPDGDNVMPRTVFMDIPSRRDILVHTMKDSRELKLYIHPQGTYVACMNGFMMKKTLKYSVELYDTSSNTGSIPHQQILIERDVNQFHGVFFEPNQNKVGIVTQSKKVLRAGEKQFSNDPNINTLDMYQIKQDNLLGFVVKAIGGPMSEKIIWMSFSCVGNIFCTIEKETPTR